MNEEDGHDVFPNDTNEIKTLTPEEAEALMEYLDRNFLRIELNGLATLTPDVAKVLAQYRGELPNDCPIPPMLELGGLTEISPEVAEELAKTCRSLSLCGLRSVSIAVAKILASRRGVGDLVLDGLEELDAEVADALPLSTYLRGLKTLRYTARWLEDSIAFMQLTFPARYVEARLSLDRFSSYGQIETLTIEQAEVLREILDYRCHGFTEIALHRLKSIDPETLKVLTDTRCRLSVLDLSGLQALNPDTAELLAGCDAWLGNLSNLKILDAATARSLAEYQPKEADNNTLLNLGGLKRLPSDVAEQLAKSKCWGISLAGVDGISHEAAKSLTQFKGEYLDLSGLMTLDDATAEWLAQFRGDDRRFGLAIDLSGLTVVSAKAAKTLRANPGIALPDKFRR